MKKLLYISLLAPLAAMAQQPKDSITQLEEVVVKAEAPIKRIQKAAYNVVAIEAQPLQAVNSNAADILARVSGVKMSASKFTKVWCLLLLVLMPLEVLLM